MFEKPRQARAWRAELRRLSGSLAPVELVEPDGATPGRLLWCLPVLSKPNVLARLGVDQADHDRSLVPVNAKVFNRLWLVGGLNSPEHPDGYLLHKDMTSDSRYRHAVDGFVTGWDSPALLADVTPERGYTPSVGFNNGVTRTFWLLANNVAAFPVLVAGEGNAKALAKLAGTDDSIMRASKVVRDPEKVPQSGQESSGTKGGGVRQKRVENMSEKASRSQERPSHGRDIGADD